MSNPVDGGSRGRGRRRVGLALGLVAAVVLSLALTGLATSAGRVDNVARVGDAHGQVEQVERIEQIERSGFRAQPEQGPAGQGRDAPRSTAVGSAPTRADERLAHAQAQRQRILAAARAREAAAARSDASPGIEPSAAPDELTDRTDGAHPALLAALNSDFLPLASECITTAKQADPELGGMLTMNLDIVADEDLGAVIETIDFPVTDNVADAELQTCVRETALSMMLPPDHSGRAQLMITLDLDD